MASVENLTERGLSILAGLNTLCDCELTVTDLHEECAAAMDLAHQKESEGKLERPILCDARELREALENILSTRSKPLSLEPIFSVLHRTSLRPSFFRCAVPISPRLGFLSPTKRGKTTGHRSFDMTHTHSLYRTSSMSDVGLSSGLAVHELAPSQLDSLSAFMDAAVRREANHKRKMNRETSRIQLSISESTVANLERAVKRVSFKFNKEHMFYLGLFLIVS